MREKRQIRHKQLKLNSFDTKPNIIAEIYRRCMDKGLLVSVGNEIGVYTNRGDVPFPVVLVDGTGVILAAVEVYLVKVDRNRCRNAQVYADVQLPWVGVYGAHEIDKGVKFLAEVSNRPSICGSSWEQMYYQPALLRRSNAGIMEAKKGAVVNENKLTMGQLR